MSAAEVDIEATGEFIRPAANRAPPDSGIVAHALNQRNATQQRTRSNEARQAALSSEPSSRTRWRTDTNPAWPRRPVASTAKVVVGKVVANSPTEFRPIPVLTAMPAGTTDKNQTTVREALPAEVPLLPADEPVIVAQARVIEVSQPQVDTPVAIAAAPVAARPGGVAKSSWIIAAAAAAVVGLAVWWVMSQRLPSIDPRQVVATNMAAARSAFAAGRVIDPPERSAFYYYSTVLALDPSNAEAKNAIAQIANQFIDAAETNLDSGNLAATVAALQGARRVQPDDPRLAAIDGQLREQLEQRMQQSREAIVAEQPAVTTIAKPAEAQATPRSASAQRELAAKALADAAQAISHGQLDVARILIENAKEAGAPATDLANLTAQLASAEQGRGKDDLLRLVLQRTAENQLLEPAQDSARHYLDKLTQADAAYPGLQQGIKALGGRLVANAQVATFGKDYDLAAHLLSQARTIGFNGVELDAAEAALSAARAPAAALAAAASVEPKLVKYIPPEYPHDGRIRGTEGWVDLTLAVTGAGDVVDSRIDNSNVGVSFGRAAAAAAKQWKYERRTLADANATQSIQVRVTFKLGQDKTHQRLGPDTLSMNRR